MSGVTMPLDTSCSLTVYRKRGPFWSSHPANVSIAGGAAGGPAAIGGAAASAGAGLGAALGSVGAIVAGSGWRGVVCP
jgi:hypothetical protein